jgi:hypothetical protein
VAASTIITALHLSAAGITDAALATALLGMTVGAAATLLQEIIGLASAGGAIARKGVVRYTLQGQSTEFDIASLQAAWAFLDRLKSNGRGGLMIPVAFT